jgi:hypothetical protein
LLLITAAGLCWYIWRRRNERVAADEVRSILNSRIEEYKRAGSIRAGEDRYFSNAVKDDLASGWNSPEEIEKNRITALNAERDGRGLFLTATTLGAVLKHSRTKAAMVSLMEHYVLEFGRDSAEQARLRNETGDPKKQEEHDTDALAASVAVAALNGILAQIKK